MLLLLLLPRSIERMRSPRSNTCWLVARGAPNAEPDSATADEPPNPLLIPLPLPLSLPPRRMALVLAMMELMLCSQSRCPPLCCILTGVAATLWVVVGRVDAVVSLPRPTTVNALHAPALPIRQAGHGGTTAGESWALSQPRLLNE